MSTYAEQPFTEFEERYFLAEILKKSALPPAALLNIIREAGIEPAWTEIALPNGRSLSACQHAYSALFSRTAMAPIQLADPSRRLKRPFSSMGDATTVLPRELQPRPPTFASVNGQQVPIPPPTLMSPVEPQRKKRGRPTKSEFERRQQEARERGEVWPKPRKPKARPSNEGSEAALSTAEGSSSVAGGGVEISGERTPPAASGTAPLVTHTASAPTAAMYSPGTPVARTQPRTPGASTSFMQSSEPRLAESGSQSQSSNVHEQARLQEGLRQPGQGPPSLEDAPPQRPGQGIPGTVQFPPQQALQFQAYQPEERWQGHQQSQHGGQQEQ